MASTARRRGVVAEFDHDRGYGTLVCDGDGDGIELFFHCTAVADGTRTIAPGAVVTFDVVAGRRGRWEAADIRPA